MKALTPEQRRIAALRDRSYFKPNAVSAPGPGRVIEHTPAGVVNRPSASNSAGAPNATSGVAGFGESCSTSDDCGGGLVCSPFDVCVGIPMSVPPAVCGPHSSPSASTVSCVCDSGYHDDGTGTCVEDIHTGVPGNLVEPCTDDLGNAGYKDSAGLCVTIQCGQGQGRGDTTQACMDCGINGFQADGIHCNECPPGSSGVDPATNTCACPAGKKWNANFTACIDANPPAGSPPQPSPPVVPKCDPATQVYDLTTNTCIAKTCNPQTQIFDQAAGNGKGACVAKPPATSSSGGNGTLYAVLAVAAVAAMAIVATAPKKKGGKKSTRSHAVHAR